MPWPVSKIVVIALLLFAAGPALADLPAEARAAIDLGTKQMLDGDYDGALATAERLQQQYPENGYGHTLAINSLVTKLSWNEHDESLDDKLTAEAQAALDICQARTRMDPADVRAWADCGVAHFAFSYLYALRGRLFRAGAAGQKTIDALEEAVNLDSSYIDARLHLGIANFYADNLPPFVRAFARLLWFIPEGDEEKALPYVEDVIQRGDEYRDVAKFVYADLLAKRGSDGDDLRSAQIMVELADAYPQNLRLHLAAIRHLVQAGDSRGAIDAFARFAQARNDWPPLDEALMSVWNVRALLDLGRGQDAINAFDQIFIDGLELPFWIEPWLALTTGQVMDLKDNREVAVAAYRSAIRLNRQYPSDLIRSSARAGIAAPFSLR